MLSQLSTSIANDKMDTGFVTSVVVIGLVIVFIVLLVLVIFLAIFGKTFSSSSKVKKEKTPKKEKNQNAQVINIQPVIEEGIDDEVIAVIAAAIATISNETGKKLSIRSIRKSNNIVNLWARAGALENTRPF
jgi:sodium pump decarboxylase gamma subunit